MFFFEPFNGIGSRSLFYHQRPYYFLNLFLQELRFLEREWPFLEIFEVFFVLNISVLIDYFILHLYDCCIALVLYQYCISAISVLYLLFK